MKFNLVFISCLSILLIGINSTPEATSDIFVKHNKSTGHQTEVKTESLDFFDEARRRAVPVVLYSPVEIIKTASRKRSKLKLAILNHGYGGKNTDYSFIANNLVAHGYCVASIQHQLPSDEPLPTTGNPYLTRKPNWERGARNILFVIQELKRIRPDLDFKNLLLVGHSNGGDTAMLFAQEHSALVRKVISLDNRRMPIPRTSKPQILSIRSSDQPADAGVLPGSEEQKKFDIKIIKLNNTRHDDMWDGATEKQKQEINQIINSFLAN
jgi:predicted dienelactone hydrolase